MDKRAESVEDRDCVIYAVVVHRLYKSLRKRASVFALVRFPLLQRYIVSLTSSISVSAFLLRFAILSNYLRRACTELAHNTAVPITSEMFPPFRFLCVRGCETVSAVAVANNSEINYLTQAFPIVDCHVIEEVAIKDIYY